MNSNPFDFVESITFTKTDLIADGREEKDYIPFLVNRALSMYPDTVLYANETNFWRDLDGRLQYDYLRGSVRKAKRRSGKWPKADDEIVKLVSKRFRLSPAKAKQVIDLLNDGYVEELRRMENMTK